LEQAALAVFIAVQLILLAVLIPLLVWLRLPQLVVAQGVLITEITQHQAALVAVKVTAVQQGPLVQQGKVLRGVLTKLVLHRLAVAVAVVRVALAVVHQQVLLVLEVLVLHRLLLEHLLFMRVVVVVVQGYRQLLEVLGVMAAAVKEGTEQS
jgi:hypothetical protein